MLHRTTRVVPSVTAFWPALFSLPSRKRLPGENPNSKSQSHSACRSNRSPRWPSLVGTDSSRDQSVVVGQDGLHDSSEPGPRLRSAERRPGHAWWPDAHASRSVGAVPFADLPGAAARLQHRPRRPGKPNNETGANGRGRSDRRPCTKDRWQPQAAQSAANIVPQGGLFWDGRADTLQRQASGPLLDPREMDGGSIEIIAEKLRHAPYAGKFAALFGQMLIVPILYARWPGGHPAPLRPDGQHPAGAVCGTHFWLAGVRLGHRPLPVALAWPSRSCGPGPPGNTGQFFLRIGDAGVAAVCDWRLDHLLEVIAKDRVCSLRWGLRLIMHLRLCR